MQLHRCLSVDMAGCERKVGMTLGSSFAAAEQTLSCSFLVAFSRDVTAETVAVDVALTTGIDPDQIQSISVRESRLSSFFLSASDASKDQRKAWSQRRLHRCSMIHGSIGRSSAGQSKSQRHTQST